MIPQIVRGEFMPALITYLFGPGRANEHENQHLIAGYADAAFSAPDRLWESEPGVQRAVHREARDLGWEVEYPHLRWGTEVPKGHVWHCSLSIKAAEGQLTDSQWTEAAHAMMSALGFDGSDGKAPCRWVAVRHGLSTEGNDHIHLAVNLVREDGTKASVWNDYKKASAVCTDLETRFGLEHVAGRMNGRNVPEPSRADREISAARGEPEPLRIRLERKVRACAAAARSEAHFVALARQHGLLVRPRYADDRKTTVIGYAVADRDGRTAYNRRTGKRGLVWFGGGKLATDLALPKLRERWQPMPITKADAAEALAAWSAAVTITAVTPARTRHSRVRAATEGDYDTASVADALAAAATGLEGETPGALSEAARRMARAAQEDPAPRNPAAADAVRTMADTFLAVTFAGESDLAGALILMQEVGRLADTCAARATTVTAQREARKATALVATSVEALTRQAAQQAATTLTRSTRGTTMSEPTHEEEALRLLAQAGVLSAQLARAIVGGDATAGTSAGTRAGPNAQITRLRAAGYTETTPYDDLLRELFGEERWARYVQDDARIAAAAAITDADRTGIYDMVSLLTRAVGRRAWENDPTSPARSVAEILHHRVTTEAARSKDDFSRTADGDSPSSPPLSPFDAKLRRLLGEERWQQYAEDPRRRDVAKLLNKAAAEGRDMDKLLTEAVTMRGFEKDPKSPARRVAGVLHYRIDHLLDTPPEESTPVEIPVDIAGLVSNASAPAGTGGTRDQQASPSEPNDTLPPGYRNGRPPEGRYDAAIR